MTSAASGVPLRGAPAQSVRPVAAGDVDHCHSSFPGRVADTGAHAVYDEVAEHDGLMGHTRSITGDTTA